MNGKTMIHSSFIYVYLGVFSKKQIPEIVLNENMFIINKNVVKYQKNIYIGQLGSTRARSYFGMGMIN
jgi:hypothetical protein